MPEQKASAALEYAQSRYHRVPDPNGADARPTDYADRPHRNKVYGQVRRVALPVSLPTGLGTLADVSGPLTDEPGAVLPLTVLGGLMRLSCGLLERRIAINWDWSVGGLSYTAGTTGRGTPSGGGLFPAEMYWVCGQSSPVLPGIYHYDSAHHALDRLLVGDVSGRVRRALGGHPSAATDQFLLVSIRFWKNSFKYNNFSYYLTTQDLGCVLGSLRPLLRSAGVEPTFLQWFDDEELSRVLGLDTPQESVFAVIPLPGRAPDPDQGPGQRAETPAADGEAKLVTKPAIERSRRILDFPLWKRVHMAALVGAQSRPPAKAADAAAAVHEPGPDAIGLPTLDHGRIDRDLTEVFSERRSSFGRFEARPMSLGDFGVLLHETAAGTVRTDTICGGARPLTRLMAFVNRVDDIEAGVYAYHRPSHRLTPVSYGDRSGLLQSAYLLKNYNMEHIAAMLVVVGRTEAVIDLNGDRGLRILHAEAGMMTQTAYLTAAALGLGCGAVLGMDNIAVNRELGLAGTDEMSVSFIMVGPERALAAGFDGRLG